ncbi:hypothetical protein MARLIPOL_01165 [Marinobacter lipolyticus SM19]|uniref:Uncharacterized protein n=1 Tax=Marinobacter lipolyticus SM19 TaxID=1318628 RepID=R8B5R1_9GAMM|nr:hypothetical protein [Marinobacter lipolyticus]EON93896.1 hypothetical protein MARLIPOL_01165 [Marinobacter lipolyticus SM19]
MLDKIRNGLVLYIRLGRIFFRIAPIATLYGILMSFAAQALMLVSFLLPLKIILLLSSPELPGFLPLSIQELGKERLVLGLSLVTVVFYALKIFSDKRVVNASVYGADKVVDYNNKLTSFEDQDSFSRSAYKKYVEALSNALFVLLSFCLFLIIYPDIFFVIIGFLFSCFLIFRYGWKGKPGVSEGVVTEYSSIISLLSTVGFVLVFFFIVIDSLYFLSPNFLVTLACLILTRQVMAQLSSFLILTLFHEENRGKVEASFFEKSSTLDYPQKSRIGVWGMLAKNDPYALVSDFVYEHAGVKVQRNSISWKQSGVLNIYLFRAFSEGGRSFALKIFGRKQKSLALHEASLLYSVDTKDGLPAPKLIATQVVDGCHCHLFEEGVVGEKPYVRPKVLEKQLLISCIKFRPDSLLVEQYKASRGMIWERLGRRELDHIKLLSRDSDLSVINDFFEIHGDICDVISKLPMYVNPGVFSQALMEFYEDSGHCVLHWGKWKLLPVGAGWPVDDVEELECCLPSLTSIREEIGNFDFRHYRVAALYFAIVRSFEMERFDDAIRLMSSIVLESKDLCH